MQVGTVVEFLVQVDAGLALDVDAGRRAVVLRADDDLLVVDLLESERRTGVHVLVSPGDVMPA